VDETHKSHDFVLGTAYLIDYLIDLKSFGSTLPVVCEDNQKNIPFELRFENLIFIGPCIIVIV
jgi:hypothetical protein